MSEKKINLDETIQKRFPVSMFSMLPEIDEQTMVHLYRAYSLGFKEGYGLSHPAAIIDLGSKPTLGELLYAAQQKGPQDS